MDQYCGNVGSIFFAQDVRPPRMSFTVILSTSDPLISSSSCTAFWESLPSLQITYTGGEKHTDLSQSGHMDGNKLESEFALDSTCKLEEHREHTPGLIVIFNTSFI